MYEGRDVLIASLLERRFPGLRDKVAGLLASHRATGKALADLVLESGMLSRHEFFGALALSLNQVSRPVAAETWPEEAVALMPGELARRMEVIPLAVESGILVFAAMDPFHAKLEDELSFALGRPVRSVVIDPLVIRAILERHFSLHEGGEPGLRRLVDSLNKKSGGEPRAGGGAASDAEEAARQAKIVRLVDGLLLLAIQAHASDLHLEPFEKSFKVRYRVDGTLCELPSPPVECASPVVSRVKVLAGLDIAERRVPQDGRINAVIGGRTVDLRVSTLPTQFGESVVLRVLDQSAITLDLEKLGMPAGVLDGVKRAIRRPNGLFITTGPTGSGKTTTLYSCLRALNEPDTKLLTAEDPVEYEIPGVMQLAVRPQIGLGFSRALRSFLRQDPDVIMVGEIRDLETAEISIQAALTGHLVLTTLHTVDAPGAVVRLVDMGVEPYRIAACLEGVLAQRLLRKLCGRCRVLQEPEGPEGIVTDVSGELGSSGRFWRAVGCDHCNGTGYRGRLGVFEWLRIGDEFRELILRRTPLGELRRCAAAGGLETLRTAAMRAAKEGVTSLEEVLRHT